MIENNPTNVSSTFEMLLEEVEAEIDFVNGVGAKGFEARDYDKAKEALERAGILTAFRDKLATLTQGVGGVGRRRRTRRRRGDSRPSVRTLASCEKACERLSRPTTDPILQVLEQMSSGSGKVSDDA